MRSRGPPQVCLYRVKEVQERVGAIAGAEVAVGVGVGWGLGIGSERIALGQSSSALVGESEVRLGLSLQAAPDGHGTSPAASGAPSGAKHAACAVRTPRRKRMPHRGRIVGEGCSIHAPEMQRRRM